MELQSLIDGTQKLPSHGREGGHDLRIDFCLRQPIRLHVIAGKQTSQACKRVRVLQFPSRVSIHQIDPGLQHWWGRGLAALCHRLCGSWHL